VTASLSGLTVVVTRPERQARELIARLSAAGASVVEFPALAIEPVTLTAHDRRRLAPDSYDWTIYTSTNAVEQSLLQLKRPVQTRIAAIGNATARALRGQGFEVRAVPQHRANSEGLLELPEFSNVEGLRVLVLRGVGGRDTLRTRLLAGGARVTVGELYRRVGVVPTAGAVAGLRAAVDPGSQTVVAVTSVDVLDSLLRGVPDELLPALLRAPLVLPGDRVAAAAHERGWNGPLAVAASAEDEAMVDALVAWHGTGARGTA